jgi:hypothetical protein
MQENFGSLAGAAPHLNERMAGDKIVDERSNVPTGGDSIVCRASQDVNSADPCDVDDHLRIIRPAEREPGITFVRYTPLGSYLQTRLDECGFNAVELRQFARRPVRILPKKPL